MSLTRREWMRTAAAAGAALLPPGCGRRTPPAVVVAPEPLVRFAGKVPMKLINDRPTCIETPWSYFRQDFTPNEAFYVRWHLQTGSSPVDLATWRLRIDGAVDTPLELSMADLKKFGGDEVIAVNQCSGNSRSLLAPRVSGAQWTNGAMGNARWGGISLAKLLGRAGVKRDAVQVTFDGLDEGTLPAVPDFIKALDIDRAMQPEVTVAWSMNNDPLPLLNGFPARLVVPGWYATYWVKALHRITVLPKVYDGYWMAKAYKMSTAPNGDEDPKALAKDTVPISRLNVRSFFTTPDDNAEVPSGKPCALDGIAFDGGSGIRGVEVSADGGATWLNADLGDDLGRYSFRRWRLNWTPPARGEYQLKVRAAGRDGGTQPEVAGWSRGGYMRNVVERLALRAT